MREDAAAAARRIVEEVLAHHGHGDAPVSETVATPVPSAPADEASPDGAPAPPDRDGSAGEPARNEEHEAETELLAAAGDAASVAAQIARRIVAEALADAQPPTGRPAVDDLHDTGPEVSVRGVPAEGLSVEDERTVGIEVPDEPAAAEGPSARGVASEPTEPAEAVAPAPTPGSAAEIVRRIVADVQTEATPPADEAGAPADESPTPADESTTAVGEPARADAGDATSPDEDGTAPGDSRRPEPDTTAVLHEQRPETATAALPQQHSVTVGAPLEARAGGEAAPAAAARSGRELEGWATPLRPDPSDVASSPEGAPRTLRWLLASLLGAVALAVLFPLAVAALRALVAMD